MCMSPLIGVRLAGSHEKPKILPFGKYELGDENPTESLRKIGGFEFLTIPCGHCIECRLKYSRHWATRCCLEASEHEHNYFLTLTYDDDHLPVDQFLAFDPATGEVNGLRQSSPLRPRDVQLFLKRLREAWSRKHGCEDIRFFLSGEYGSHTMRPHYHMIAFNLPIFDLVQYKKNFRGEILFNSAEIQELWSHGYVVIGEVTFDSAAYVARYILKKQTGPGSAGFYESQGLFPEFSRMSRRPGLARQYYDRESGRIYQYDQIILTDGNGLPKKVKPPAYFDRLYGEEEPEAMKVIKDRRRDLAEISLQQRLEKTDLTEVALAAQRNDKILLSSRKLLRSDF